MEKGGEVEGGTERGAGRERAKVLQEIGCTVLM